MNSPRVKMNCCVAGTCTYGGPDPIRTVKDAGIIVGEAKREPKGGSSVRHHRILVLHKNGCPHRVGRALGDIGEATREWKEVHRDKIVVVLSCENDPGETWMDDDTSHHPSPRTRIGVAPTLGTAWRVVLFERRAEGLRIAYTLQWGLPDQTEARKRASAWRKRWPRPMELLWRLKEHAEAAARRLAPEGDAG